MGRNHRQMLADCFHNVHIHKLIIIKDKKYFISSIENIHYCTSLASSIQEKLGTAITVCSDAATNQHSPAESSGFSAAWLSLQGQ